MPDNNKQLAAARKVYETYWDSYVKGDLETFASTLDETYEMIGTSEKEICRTKAEGIDFFKAQIQEVGGKTAWRNRQITTKPLKDMVLINEINDIYVLVGQEWTFYSKIRISTLLLETDSGWKIIQQHGSFPDMRVQEGETLAIEKINQENIALRDAVKRRTTELEHKNWELEIESALERVRTIAMGMKKPDDLLDVCRIISQQLEKLKLSNIRNVQVAIIDEPKKIYANYQHFTAYAKGIFEEIGYENNPASLAMVTEMQKSANAFFIGSIKGDELKKFRDWRKYYKQLPDPILDQSTELFYYFYSIGQGGLGLTTYHAINDVELEIFKRFHLVFKLAYSRFMDIQKAEAQAREAQVEAAIERVRAQSMAMHHTDDIIRVTEEMIDQLKKLQVDGLVGASIYLVDEDDIVKVWDISSPGSVSDQGSYAFTYDAKKFPVLGDWVQTWRTSPQHYFVLDFPKETLLKVVDEFKEVLPEMAGHFKNAIESGKLTHQWNPAGRLSEGILSIDLTVPPTDDTKNIVTKMAGAFNLAYQRFLDLQKAEAQAREAKIEAALERTRNQSMLMQHSDEITNISDVFHQQLLELNIPTEFSYVWLPDESKNNHQFWASWAEQKKGELIFNSKQVTYPLDKTEPYTAACYQAWEDQENVHVEFIPPAEIPDFFNTWAELLEGAKNLKAKHFTEGIYYAEAYMRFGCFGINIRRKLSTEEKQVLKRFSIEFERAYTRFLDLQKTEARAKESQLELSLERIRATVTGMQESADLLNIVVTMRNEFVNLGHEAQYFWHMRWLPDIYKKAMTSGDGTKIGMVMTLPRHIHGDIPLVAKWEKSIEPTYVLAMDVDLAVDYVDKMIHLGDFERVDPQAPTLDDIRHIGGLTFVMARTTHGEIGYSLPGMVPNPPKEALDTLVRFAGVFDLAYKRFEDLKKAEKDIIEIKAAKQKAEEALIELKATQSQLIQQEKLASLGQLTAGIAHEIQNPLNFVNNFSEVSAELLDEVREELVKTRHALSPSVTEFPGKAADPLNEAEAILTDIKQNLEKITHHGKRADAIVKGMLQHSRTSSGQKEPTDLNALADEYLRLSYHGLRAKDKSFNANFKTEFDASLPKIMITPQDIGRVMLNLITNAFYAVNERVKKDLEDIAEKDNENLEGREPIKPLVIVTTKNLGNTIEISVKDNGSGIPNEIKNKIFQPFFTTKPTGQGTGLGLSLSYDIVKAHGGELKVKTKEDEGTTFIVQLPI